MDVNGHRLHIFCVLTALYSSGKNTQLHFVFLKIQSTFFCAKIADNCKVLEI